MDAEDEDTKSSRSSDDESMGSLKEFIVKDESESESSETEDSSGEETEITEEDSDESESSDDASEDSADENSNTKSVEKPEEPKVKRIRLTKEKEDEIAELKAEAERFVSGTSGTTIGSRTLRSRAPEALESRKPKDTYYEKYAKQEEAKLMEKFKKKDIIDFLKKLEPEWRKQFEDAGNTWPVLKITMTLESIEASYKPIKEFAHLPDSDDEESDASIDSDENEMSDLESEESI